MNDILMHDHTKQSVERYLSKPSHALLLSGANGTGKSTLANHIAARLLNIAADKLESYPYFAIVLPGDKKSIGIDDIRGLKHFVSLKIPSRKSGFTRVIIVEQAQTMTQEAQNALLKLVEEPPDATAIILTATSGQALLPTITSRVQTIAVYPVPEGLCKQYFKNQEFSEAEIQKAWLVSGGLVGLMSAYLLNETEHPLIRATDTAKQLLQKGTYERLLLVDELAKQPDALQDVLFVMQQMAQLSLRHPNGSAAEKQWQKVLTSSYRAEEALERGAQTKLALTNLMLTL